MAHAPQSAVASRSSDSEPSRESALQSAPKPARRPRKALSRSRGRTQAAVAVGYGKGRSARSAAQRFLAELDTVRTLREVARVAYGDIGRLFDAEGRLIPLADLDEDVHAVIASIELWPDGTPKRIKLWPKIEALEMAMRHAGLFGQFIRSEVAEWTQVVKDAGVKID
jgi:hypothetical protein